MNTDVSGELREQYDTYRELTKDYPESLRVSLSVLDDLLSKTTVYQSEDQDGALIIEPKDPTFDAKIQNAIDRVQDEIGGAIKLDVIWKKLYPNLESCPSIV